MNSLIENQIKTISIEGLYLVYKDATNRIGTHYAGGYPDQNYLAKQEAIISAVQEELKIRKQKGEM
ncbi:hypothetical protein [Heyndrickxia oleronia]|uniref:hypothetical protein n=1 Tax=Heyndrickxia oleronia TaxID=38875 RepID=UPI001B0E713A|nr:hypothetical protein [Heyndrickxia oleronia]GIN37821.1 hypothetical protein J19TS1_07700 [Heyndrickxia oleronia]